MPSQSLTTELAFLPFPEHINLHDPSTPAGAVWQRVLVTVSHAPGYRGSRWGYQLNKPGIVWYLVGTRSSFLLFRFAHKKGDLLADKWHRLGLHRSTYDLCNNHRVYGAQRDPVSFFCPLSACATTIYDPCPVSP